ncbi:MAG: hypothetical protein WKG07_17385 [Hymenobacter sp.]
MVSLKLDDVPHQAAPGQSGGRQVRGRPENGYPTAPSSRLCAPMYAPLGGDTMKVNRGHALHQEPEKGHHPRRGCVCN